MATPSGTVPSGTRLLYPKSDGWYEKSSGGVETKLSGGAASTPDTWHIVNNANEPEFITANGWKEFAVDDVAFIKDSAGVVHLRGRVVPGTAGTAAFQLPTGYRPSETLTGIAAYAHNPPALSYINVTATGNVIIGTATSGWVGLSTVHFSTA